jgi:hypothetical protein
MSLLMGRRVRYKSASTLVPAPRRQQTSPRASSLADSAKIDSARPHGEAVNKSEGDCLP